jgi:glycerophosphoryl diester phosphodiesterase
LPCSRSFFTSQHPTAWRQIWIGCEALVLHHEGVTPDKVQKIKAAGIEVGAWTVNDRATMEKLLLVGVERIYTDHPQLLLSLKSK